LRRALLFLLAAPLLCAALTAVSIAASDGAYSSDKVPFLVRFDSNVRGLEVGTEVEVHGIPVGTVSEARLFYDEASNNFLVDVILSLEPARFPSIGVQVTNAEEAYAAAAHLVERGLRARLVSSGLKAQLFSQSIGSALVIELAMMPDQPPATLDRDGPIPELPTGPSPSDEVLDSLREALGKLAKAPIEKALSDLQAAAAALRAFAEGPSLQEALDNVAASTKQLQAFMERMDVRMERLSDGAARTFAAAGSTLGEARETLLSVQRTVGERSPLIAEMNRMLREMAGAGRSLRLMAEYLERHPDALIKGKKDIRQ